MTTYTLPPDPSKAHRIVSGPIWAEVKALTAEGRRLTVTVTDSKSRAAEARYHAMIAEISKHVGGDLADRDDAKRILISAFRIDTRIEFADEWARFGDTRMGRGLRGEVVLLGIQSRHFTRKLAHVFTTWLEAFGAEHGVNFSVVVDPETGEILSNTEPTKNNPKI